VAKAASVIQDLAQVVARGGGLSPQDVDYALSLANEGGQASLAAVSETVLQLNGRGQQIRPRTLGQKAYVEAIRQHGITFAIGPAGTGKTYLAMTMAVAALRHREVERLILTRPAVEAGEKLGFLPGDLQDKVDPYLRPLYDALNDLLGAELVSKHMERGIIEVAPLAYMRGRTLNNAFIILDEAQNTTPEQMKMFLTRLGWGSRAVVTGDITQVDLPRGKHSGLREIPVILRDVEGIALVYLTAKDVVRHSLVQKIIEAYARYEEQQEWTAAAGDGERTGEA
jgi:phosphate starvation-inducible PhoH-like protein